MQIRSENIIALILPSAVAVLLFILDDRVTAMPDSVFYIGITLCSVVIIGSILALTPIWKKLFNTKSISMPVAIDYSTTIKEQGQEPSNNPPSAFNYILTACSLLMLAFGLLSAYLWITGRIMGQINLHWMFFFIVFIILPILALLDILVWERKYYKVGKSAKYEEKTIIMLDDINNIFNRCLKVLNIKPMETSVIRIDRPKLIKAHIAGSIVTIKARHMAKGLVNIHILSDSKWITTKIDFGINRRNVDKIARLIRLEMK